MSGTDLASAGTAGWEGVAEGCVALWQCPVLVKRMLLSSYTHALQCPVLAQRMLLCEFYAMAGTGLAYAAICRRACYAVSGTDRAYVAVDRGGTRPWSLHTWPGNGTAKRSIVLRYENAMAAVLCEVRYTDVGYVTTRVWSPVRVPTAVRLGSSGTIRCMPTCVLCDVRY
eukprot:28317-Rhodomonas_salina.3